MITNLLMGDQSFGLNGEGKELGLVLIDCPLKEKPRQGILVSLLK